MKLSQLTEVKLLTPLELQVKGETVIEGEGEGSGELKVHVAIVQGDRLFTGDTTAPVAHPEWVVQGLSQRIEAGPAQALGLTIEIRREPLSFQTFTWGQDVNVLPPDAA
jgi:hypothetical protein